MSSSLVWMAITPECQIDEHDHDEHEHKNECLITNKESIKKIRFLI